MPEGGRLKLPRKGSSDRGTSPSGTLAALLGDDLDSDDNTPTLKDYVPKSSVRPRRRNIQAGSQHHSPQTFLDTSTIQGETSTGVAKRPLDLISPLASPFKLPIFKKARLTSEIENGPTQEFDDLDSFFDNLPGLSSPTLQASMPDPTKSPPMPLFLSASDDDGPQLGNTELLESQGLSFNRDVSSRRPATHWTADSSTFNIPPTHDKTDVHLAEPESTLLGESNEESVYEQALLEFEQWMDSDAVEVVPSL